MDQVAQWSDLVVFDFLTGNYDRVSSMQVNITIIIVITITINITITITMRMKVTINNPISNCNRLIYMGQVY